MTEAKSPKATGEHDSTPSAALTVEESRDVEKRKSGTAKVVHEVVRLQGDEELDRPAISLALSGVAAGTAITASVFGTAALGMRLGHDVGSELISGLGYCIGFIIVILGKLQLFTESTITAVLPLAHNPNWHNLARLARLWLIVLTANLAGTFVVAAGISHGGIASPELLAEIRLMAAHLMAPAPLTILLSGVPAGFLVAAIAWVLPSARGSEFWVIGIITYLISICGFSHIIASSTEVWVAVLCGDASAWAGINGVILPALLGNIIGGTGLFALLAHGQVKAEL